MHIICKNDINIYSSEANNIFLDCFIECYLAGVVSRTLAYSWSRPKRCSLVLMTTPSSHSAWRYTTQHFRLHWYWNNSPCEICLGGFTIVNIFSIILRPPPPPATQNVYIKMLSIFRWVGARWPSGLEQWTGDRVVVGSNPAVATSLSELSQFRLPRFASVFLQRRH